MKLLVKNIIHDAYDIPSNTAESMDTSIASVFNISSLQIELPSISI
jgi:hypothetical protein